MLLNISGWVVKKHRDKDFSWHVGSEEHRACSTAWYTETVHTRHADILSDERRNMKMSLIFIY